MRASLEVRPVRAEKKERKQPREILFEVYGGELGENRTPFKAQPNTTLSAFGGAPVANGGAEMCKPNAAGSCYAFDDAASTPTAAADSVQHRIVEMVHPPARRLAR